MTDSAQSTPAPPRQDAHDVRPHVLRHLRTGWWLILLFLSLGIVLEGLHAFKVGWYLNVSNEARRLMWTLAHAHGTLFGLLHLGFAATLGLGVSRMTPRGVLASRCLTSASVLLPLGFLLGGIFIHGGDPGYGVLLVPAGAVLLLLAAALTAMVVRGDARNK